MRIVATFEGATPETGEPEESVPARVCCSFRGGGKGLAPRDQTTAIRGSRIAFRGWRAGRRATPITGGWKDNAVRS